MKRKWVQNMTVSYLDPVTKVPEPEPEHPAVSVLEALVWRHDPVQEPVEKEENELLNLHFINTEVWNDKQCYSPPDITHIF